MFENFLYFFPVLLGVVCGVMFGFSTGNFAIRRYLAVSEQNPAPAIAGNATGLGAVPFICYAGWVIGGKLGVHTPTAWESLPASIRVGVGIFMVELVLVAFAVIFGVLAWKVAQRLGQGDAA